MKGKRVGSGPKTPGFELSSPYLLEILDNDKQLVNISLVQFSLYNVDNAPCFPRLLLVVGNLRQPLMRRILHSINANYYF